ncbi:MAG: NAD(P) transhydrogenase subunit beta [Pirellulaceae bacterium]|jgi:NAD(P) transhydrogenase subunit beta
MDSATIQILLKLTYLVASVFFVFGLKKMTHPKTALMGNFFGATGMAIAVGAALLDSSVEGYVFIVVGVIIGAGIGGVFAIRIQMTSMPQLVALFNGFGGLASVVVAGGALVASIFAADITADIAMGTPELLATGISGLIGAVTFSGSFIAFAKLQELKAFKKPIRIPFQQPINAVIALGLVVLVIAMGTTTFPLPLYVMIVMASLLLGIFLTNPIGGADMPVVIALLNSYSGLAATATGFVMSNDVLIISGSLVGASGIILTNLMCKAMNRSLSNVLFGVMDAGGSGGDAEEIYKTVTRTSADDVAMLLDSAQRVVIVPGYGLAVAQAQHAVRDLGKLLEERGITVEYAIHPVAGRMPGHMNVLLAEADIDYDKLKEMDHINPTMEQVDVCIVIGANDVVNPVSRTEKDSPIYGMPIIDVDKARTVIVIKRSLSPGFAGIPNPLFAAENTLMFFGDGQKAVMEIISAVKEG